MSRRLSTLAILLVMALPLMGVQAAEPDPDVLSLGRRLQAIEADPLRNTYAAYERLQASQAIQALTEAKRKTRPLALQIARIRVDTAEMASNAEASRAELQKLDTERGELLVEASRRDAERARAEAERMRVEAQIQAEEAARLRAEIDAEARSREEAEGLLDTMAGSETEKLRLAKERDAVLARREAELLSGGTSKPKPKPGTKPRPKPAAKPKPPVR